MPGRLTITGGGVVGLMTAFCAARLADAVTVLERSRVGYAVLEQLALRGEVFTRAQLTGVGWRGTGYWVGRVLAQLTVQRGTVYDIGCFTPARFAGSAPVTGVAS